MSGSPAGYLRYPALLAAPCRPPADIRRIQETGLLRLAEHAGAHVPYYRELFRKAGLRPGDFRSLEALRELPTTSKADLRDLPVSERTADDVDLSSCRSFSTSGTTGVPLQTYFTKADATRKHLAWARAHRFGGLQPLDRAAVLVGRREASSRPAWYERLGLWRRREISSWEPAERWIRELGAWRPAVLLGYVMTLRILAEALRKRGESLPLKAVFHSSALMDDLSRRLLEEAFGCPVRDFYGSDEAGCMAWECPACGGYHIAADMVIVEILKDGRPAEPGQEGEVVITNLHSRAMPFIRYRQGDVAALSPRAPVCGLRFPLLEKLQGRVDDFLVLPGRGRITPHVVYHLMDPVPGLRQWRIEQDARGRLTVECGASPADWPAVSAEVESRLRGLISPATPMEIQMRESIPVEPGRKFRAVRSAVSGDAS